MRILFSILLIMAGMLTGCGDSEIGGFPADWFLATNGKLPDAYTQILGKPMPTLTVENWYGTPVDLADLQGRVVVVDLWSTWCGPCVDAIPENNKLYTKFKDQGVLIIGVCTSDQGQDRMVEVARENKVIYPMVGDPALATQNAWDIQFFPTYAVMDKTGIVRAIGLRPDRVEDVVRALLQENPK